VSKVFYALRWFVFWFIVTPVAIILILVSYLAYRLSRLLEKGLDRLVDFSDNHLIPGAGNDPR
jgi:hypothetical protein